MFSPHDPMILDIITATIHVLHAHLATPTASFCCVSCWSLTCLGQSFFQVLDRAKSNQRLAHAVARCRIRICVQAANVCAAEFCDSPSSRQPIPLTSFAAWLGHSIVQPMFVNNLRCRFSFDEPIAAQICVTDLCPC
jgi:hypothetical protein